ncbi:hypothetical protein EJB05_17825, partial [Eragrostis curvula]
LAVESSLQLTGTMAEPSHSSIPMPQDKPVVATQPSADQWITAEKRLNYFAGAVALMERVGNCLGTLAFTWATVVVLGGFSTNLGQDFWYATAIVFLEAFRVFSRESRSDDELLFKTTGSLKLKRMKLARGIPYYLTVAIVIVCMYGTLEFFLRHYGYTPPPNLRLQYHILLLSVLLALASVAQAPTSAEYLKDNSWLQFLSSLVAVLALGAAMLWSHTPKHEVVLIIPPLFVGCLQTLAKPIGDCLKNSSYDLGFQFRAWLSTLAALILPSWIVICVLIEFSSMGVLILLGTLMLGNIQIPVAVARIVLSSERLFTTYDSSEAAGNRHLAPALTIFYSLVLAQGILYAAACILESLLSSHFRRALARSCKLNYKSGYDSINLYYEHAYHKRMEEGVLAQEDMSLVTFALNSLDSNSDEKKLAAVQILYSLLQLHGPSKRGLVAQITTNTKVVASLVNILGWTASDDEPGISIRLFAAKVIASLAGDLRIVGIPGTMQMVSSLLDFAAKNQEAQPDISNQTSDKKEASIDDNRQRSHASSATVNIQGEHGYHVPANRQEPSKQVEVGNKSEMSYVNKPLEWFKRILPGQHEREEPKKDIHSFPVLGMRILERLAHDLDNTAEISKATGLILKIIGFIVNSTDTSNKFMISSMKLVAKLVSTEGETGTTIRKDILKHHFFMSNLVEILADNSSHPEQWKPMMVIIVKLIFEKGENQVDIKRFHVIIPKLMHAFFGPDESPSTDYDQSLRLVAGEALSKLAEKNHDLCSDILQEKGYGLLGDLKNMLQHDEYTHVATSLLMNLCSHSQDKMRDPRLSEQLSSILQLVLEKMVDAEGKQLEVLIITALQYHNLMPEKFAYELESWTNEEKLVRKLVGALNSNNKKMRDECRRIRRVITEITISIVESCPRYSLIFNNQRMMEALSKLERTLAEVGKYRGLFSDTETVFDSGLPPPDLVMKAKRLIGSETPSQEAQVHDVIVIGH